MTADRPSQLRALGLVMLPIALFLERGVYYQFRAAFHFRAMDAGASIKEIGAVLAIGAWVSIVGYGVGGLLSLVKGQLAILLGLGCSLLGYLLMAVAPGGWAAAEMLTRFAGGCTTLGFYAAIAAVGASFGQRMAGVALLQIAANVGGFIGPLGATASRVSPWLAYIGLFPVVLAMLLAAVDWWMANGWERTHRPTEPAMDWLHALMVAGIVIAAGILSAPIDYYASSALFDALGKSGVSSGMFVVATLVSVGGALIAGIALTLAGLIAPRSMQPAPMVGAALLCTGLGGGIGVAGSALGVVIALWLATFFGGLGSTILNVILLGVLSSAFSRRWVGLGLLVYFSATRGVAGIFYALGSADSSVGVVLGGLSAGLALLLGVVALILSKPIGAWLVKEPPAEPAAA
ncbi:MAG: hypothetical protein AB7K71_00065 [Polyangiaceae bacterium]